MARDAIAFIEAMGFQRVDLLGFSIGSFVAQEIALIRPDLLRRWSPRPPAPRGATRMHGWAPEVIGAVGQPEPNRKGYLDVFFAPTSTSQQAGQQAAGRIFGRTNNRDEPTTWRPARPSTTRCARGASQSLAARASQRDRPAGVRRRRRQRPMILPRYSYLLAGLLPNARLTIYPDSARLPLPAPQPVRSRRARLPRGGR